MSTARPRVLYVAHTLAVGGAEEMVLNLGAAVSPAVTGAITAKTGSPVYSMYLVMALYVLSGIILLLAVRSAKAAKSVQA